MKITITMDILPVAGIDEDVFKEMWREQKISSCLAREVERLVPVAVTKVETKENN
jgi:hypothetical protein